MNGLSSRQASYLPHAFEICHISRAFPTLNCYLTAIAGIASAAAHTDVPVPATWEQLQATNADAAAIKREMKSLAETVSRLSKQQTEIREELLQRNDDEQQQQQQQQKQQQQQQQQLFAHVDARMKESEGQCCLQ
jgi:hypothetical protein